MITRAEVDIDAVVGMDTFEDRAKYLDQFAEKQRARGKFVDVRS